MITVIRSGSGLHIQDLGRFGYRKFGVPLSGAMDRRSAFNANLLVGNRIDAPLLEMYMPGHEFMFDIETQVAITGARAQIFVGAEERSFSKIFKVGPGETLSIGKMELGCRSYLAIKGGLDWPFLLDSHSALRGFSSNRLKKGDRVRFHANGQSVSRTFANPTPLVIDTNRPIEVYPGPELSHLNNQQTTFILNQAYLIDKDSDGMGYRLQGETIPNYIHRPIISSGVMPGTVQLLPKGLPLILMRECQTMGGYPRILQVKEEDINQLAQRRPGNRINFALIAN